MMVSDVLACDSDVPVSGCDSGSGLSLPQPVPTPIVATSASSGFTCIGTSRGIELLVRTTETLETTLCKRVDQPTECEMAEWHSRRSDCQLVVDCGGIDATKPLVAVRDQPPNA